jgi:hypothetical protein
LRAKKLDILKKPNFSATQIYRPSLPTGFIPAPILCYIRRNTSKHLPCLKKREKLDHPMNTIKSKQRVADHGEVFTPPWLVEAMLDLVKEETERIEGWRSLGDNVIETITEQMNQAVFTFRRYEDASLRYTGIDSHPSLRHVGLYDTVVARE